MSTPNKNTRQLLEGNFMNFLRKLELGDNQACHLLINIIRSSLLKFRTDGQRTCLKNMEGSLATVCSACIEKCVDMLVNRDACIHSEVFNELIKCVSEELLPGLTDMLPCLITVDDANKDVLEIDKGAIDLVNLLACVVYLLCTFMSRPKERSRHTLAACREALATSSLVMDTWLSRLLVLLHRRRKLETRRTRGRRNTDAEILTRLFEDTFRSTAQVCDAYIKKRPEFLSRSASSYSMMMRLVLEVSRLDGGRMYGITLAPEVISAFHKRQQDTLMVQHVGWLIMKIWADGMRLHDYQPKLYSYAAMFDIVMRAMEASPPKDNEALWYREAINCGRQLLMRKCRQYALEMQNNGPQSHPKAEVGRWPMMRRALADCRRFWTALVSAMPRVLRADSGAWFRKVEVRAESGSAGLSACPIVGVWWLHIDAVLTLRTNSISIEREDIFAKTALECGYVPLLDRLLREDASKSYNYANGLKLAVMILDVEFEFLVRNVDEVQLLALFITIAKLLRLSIRTYLDNGNIDDMVHEAMIQQSIVLQSISLLPLNRLAWEIESSSSSVGLERRLELLNRTAKMWLPVIADVILAIPDLVSKACPALTEVCAQYKTVDGVMLMDENVACLPRTSSTNSTHSMLCLGGHECSFAGCVNLEGASELCPRASRQRAPRVCRRCERVSYCSAMCQWDDWSRGGHSLECNVCR